MTFQNWFRENKLAFFFGLGIILFAVTLSHDFVRFILHIVRRAFPQTVPWISDFEKLCSRPISWLILISLIWLSFSLFDFDTSFVSMLFKFAVGIPLIWTIMKFFMFLTKTIIRYQGWDRSKSKDDYSRIVIITEGIALFKYFLIILVAFFIYVEELNVESTNFIVVVIISLEIMLVFGSYTWVKNIVGGLVLIVEEPITIGSHVKILGHEGFIEGLYLRQLVIRRLDKSIVTIPNGVLLDSPIELKNVATNWIINIDVHIDHSTPAQKIREFIQEVDSNLSLNYDMSSYGTSISSIQAKSKLLTTGARSESDNDDINRKENYFWVSMESMYVVRVTSKSTINDIKAFAREKSEKILGFTKLLEYLNIKVYKEEIAMEMIIEENEVKNVVDEDKSPSSLLQTNNQIEDNQSNLHQRRPHRLPSEDEFNELRIP